MRSSGRDAHVRLLGHPMTPEVLVAGASGPSGEPCSPSCEAPDTLSRACPDPAATACTRSTLLRPPPRHGCSTACARPQSSTSLDRTSAPTQARSLRRWNRCDDSRCSAKNPVRGESSSPRAPPSTAPSRRCPTAKTVLFTRIRRYAELKLRSEAALGDVSRAGSLAVSCLRVFNVYGPGFANSLVNQLLLGATPTVYDTESYIRDYLHSSDAARGFRLAVEDDRADSTVMNVGTGIGISNRALLELCGNPPHRIHPRADIWSCSLADIARIRGRLGFEPSIGLADAVTNPDDFR